MWWFSYFWSFYSYKAVNFSRSQNKIVEPELLQKTNERICFSILTTQKYLKLEIEIQFRVFLSCQDRKTNSFVCFLEKFRLNNFVLRSTELYSKIAVEASKIRKSSHTFCILQIVLIWALTFSTTIPCTKTWHLRT